MSRRLALPPQFARLGALVLVPVVVSACGDQAAVNAIDSVPVQIPEQFDESGTVWTRVDEMASSEKQRLSRFFQEHPSLTEGSLIQGDPLIYSNRTGTNRFYWVRPAIDGTEWICVQMKPSELRVTEGSGPPFEVGVNPH